MTSKALTKGTIDRVPCAHCNNPQDLRELEVVDRGIGVICDACGKTSEIVSVLKTSIVGLRQV